MNLIDGAADGLSRPEWKRMSTFFTILAIVLMIATAAALLAGLRNMLVGGPGNTSQKLMRMRVMLQAIAVLVIVVVVYLAR